MNKIVKKSQVPPKQPTTRSTNSTAISQSAGSKTPVVSQPTHKHPQAGPASNTKSLQSKQANSDSKKETWSQWSKDKVTKMAQDVFSKDAPTATGVSSDKPQQFKSGDRVVLQSVNNTAIYGTVRWVGDVGIHGQSVPFVGIETVSCSLSSLMAVSTNQNCRLRDEAFKIVFDEQNYCVLLIG